MTNKKKLFLGSHNSFSYSISPSSDVSPDSPQIVQRLGKWFKPITNRIIYNWSLGQNKNVTNQLLHGVRYFDIRLVRRNREICIAHGLYGGEVFPFLQEINAFLNQHSKEVVVLDFQHFYQFEYENHHEMLRMVQGVFGNKICYRKRSMIEISLNGLWSDWKQIIIIYRHAHMANNHIFWPSYSWVTPWPNKLKVDELLEYLDNGIANRMEGVGYVTQGILTPTIKYVIFHLCGSLKNLALKSNKKLVSWLDTKINGRHGVNVVICDFIEDFEFCERVIQLNYKNYDEGIKRTAWDSSQQLSSNCDEAEGES